MGVIYFVDFGFVALIAFLVLAVIFGSTHAIIEWFNENLALVIVICIFVVAIEFALTWLFSKKRKYAFASIIYSSQFCVFATYGIYKLGIYADEHPILGVLVAFCYMFYIIFNTLGLMLPLATIETEGDDGSLGLFGFVALGAVGWIVNWIFLF